MKVLRAVLSGAVARQNADAGAGAGVGASPAGAPAQPRVQLCAIIKQDGYAMGAPRLARKLAAMGVEMLAVYCPSEARDLAEAPVKTPVLVLMPVSTFDRKDPLYRLAVAGRLHLVLHSEEQALELSSVASRVGVTFPVHVQVDTGMSRGGCLPEQAYRLVELALSSPRFRLAGVMTHFSSPGHEDEFTREQARVFRGFVDRIKPLLIEATTRGSLRNQPPVVVHAANTSGVFRSSDLHATMVRVGQGLLGYGRDALVDVANIEHLASAERLRPAVRWVSRIVHVQDVPAGWPVGYSRLWHARKPSRIAIVPVGYADGYPIALTNTGKVRLTGLAWDRPRTSEPLASRSEVIDAHSGQRGASCFAPVVGRVSMDQITIDVSDAPPELTRLGSEVEIIGDDPSAPNHLSTLAAQAGTITHQLLCSISGSLERVYLNSTLVGGSGENPGGAGGAGGAGGPGASSSLGVVGAVGAGLPPVVAMRAAPVVS